MKNNTELLQKLTGDTICLTATNRLARQIMSAYDQSMIDVGRTVWDRPGIMPLDTWCVRQLQLLAIQGLTLSQSQAAFLWEMIIKKDVLTQGHELLQVPPTARKARQAYKQLHDYQTSFTEDVATEDHQAFLRWKKSWESLLEEKGWVDPCSVVSSVANAIVSHTLKAPSCIIFSGFDDFTPVQQRFQKALADAGCVVEVLDIQKEVSAGQSVYAATDKSGEVEQCACWVRQLLTKDPGLQIGVVAPQLESYRDLVIHKFTAELDPPGKVSGADRAMPFNISLGAPLAKEGVIYAALRLLTLPQRVTAEELSWLLRTPYLRTATLHAATRGRADMKFRKKRIFELPLWKVPGALKDTGCDEPFLNVIKILMDARKSSRKELPGIWAERFARTLDACGWPGDRSLSSREYQTIDKFRETLSELASLDVVSGPVDRSTATNLLERLTRETTYQPESVDSQVQVLGILESGGLQFDYLWVLGMHAGAMPQPLRPNPFIPHSVQRRAQMPHADANRELSYAKRLISRLTASADQVVFSWPAMEDGLQNRPGAVLSGLPPAQLPEFSSSSPAITINTSGKALEEISDYNVSPLVSKKPVSGGTGIVKDQSLCPFRAFAHYRLVAKGLDSPDIGLDNMTRGTLVHSMLEFFWDGVKSHERLCSMTSDQVTAQLESAALKAVVREENSNKSDMPSRLREIEVNRLVNQGRKWLDIERNRTPFEIVEQEKLHEETIGRLHFRTRIDRIDRLEDGTLAIIDYKTGVPDPLQWFEKRISEPQLPIYCQKMSNEEIGAVLFAAVRNKPAECKFSGIARKTEMFPKLNEKKLQDILTEKGWDSIDQVLDSWRETLPELGNAFVHGDAAVDPVDRAETCKYCDLTTLCRIHESDFWADWEAGND